MAFSRPSPFLDEVSLEIALSFFDAMTAAEEDRQSEIVLAREYHEGLHGVELTDRLKEFISTDIDFRMNVCRSVVTAVVERLRVVGFDSDSEELMKWAEILWNANKLDAVQEDIYEGALRDGEYFAIVDWDTIKERIKIVPHQRYTDVHTGGDGYGCWMVYEHDDPNQDALYGVKQWTEGDYEKVQRRNLYYPDRVEKYVRDVQGNWTRYQAPEDEEWPVPWLDGSGNPLGIAIIHFTNKGLRCEAWDAFPLQDAINKSLVDLLASSDLTAFRIFYSLGFVPTTDGKQPAPDRSNWLELEPGQVVGTTKSARDAAFGSIDPASLNELMNLTHQLVLWLAMVTNTPVSRFISTKLIASDATLKEQEGPLISRVNSRQIRFGNAWAECLDIARRLENAFGQEAIDEEEDIEILWGEGAARGEMEKLDLLMKKQVIEIPHDQLWKEAGYNQKTIETMETQRDAELRDRERFGDDFRGRGRDPDQQRRDFAGRTGNEPASES